MNKTPKDRLCEFIAYLGISISLFEKKVGLSNGVIGHSKGKISSNVIEKAIKVYPMLNPLWIMTGDGDMIKQAGGSVNVDVDMSSGKHIQSPHTEISGDAAAAAAMQAKIDSLQAQVKALEADKVKLMNLLDKCIGSK